jgi:hypothetical protein
MQPWHGRVWCNPPYGRRTFRWLARVAEHGNGMTLIFARTETKGFHREVWAKADAIFFFEGRIRFFHLSGARAASANAPSCLVAYGQNNVAAIQRAMECGRLGGRLLRLRPNP